MVRQFVFAMVGLFLLGLVSCATSPTKTLPSQPPEQYVDSDELARKLIRIEWAYTGGRETVIDEWADISTEYAKAYFEEILKRQLYYGEHLELREVFRQTLSEVYTERDFEDVLTPVYKKYLTAEEMVKLIQFYQSPTGRKMLSVSKLLEEEAGKQGIKLYLMKEREFVERFETRFLRKLSE